MKPKPLDLEELKQNRYPKDIFTEITGKEWEKINKILIKELGFSLDRVSGNISRKMWKNMSEWFIERIKSACEFYLRYKDNPELLIKEHPRLVERVGYDDDLIFEIGNLIRVRRSITFRKLSSDEIIDSYEFQKFRNKFPLLCKFIIHKKYNEWLFKLAFKCIFEEIDFEWIRREKIKECGMMDENRPKHLKFAFNNDIWRRRQKCE
jgi:hypothetical protein